VLERLATRSTEPVRDVIVWADECCDRLIGAGVAAARGGEDRSTLSSRSVLIRWGYVTSQIMRDLVSDPRDWVTKIAHLETLSPDYS
jgi:regulatory factor X